MWLHALPAAPGTDAPVVATWSGASAVVEVFRDRAWRPVRGDATSPVEVGPLPSGTPVRLRRDADVLHETTWWGVLDAAVFAALSGPGQPGVDVVAMVGGADALWVAIDGVGVVRWDGVWGAPLGPRQGLPTRSLSGLALGEDGEVWVAHEAGLSRGGVAGGFSDVAGVGAARDVAVLGAAVWALDAQGAVEVGSQTRAVARDDCTRFLRAGDALIARCGASLWGLPEATRRFEFEAPGEVVGILPRLGGAWIATRDALIARVDGVDTPWWTAPTRGALAGLGRLGDGLVFATLADVGVPGLRLHPEQGLVALRAADGVDGRGARAVAVGPPPGKAWLATDRGIVLVDGDGVGSRLPLAPLAVGVPVHDVAARGRGYAFATAWGLAWIGPERPDGWDSLVAAVGTGALRVGVDASGDVWAVGEGDVFVLRQGTVVRISTGADVLDLAVWGDQIAVATAAGVRLGLPGATALSPAFAVGALAGLAFDGSGRLAMLTGDGVVIRAGGRVAAVPVEGGLTLLGDAAGFVVGTARGALRIDDPDRGAEGIADGIVAAVQTRAGLLTLDGDGTLQRRRAREVETLGRWPDARLVAAAAGVWVLGPHGVAWVPNPRELR